ncbi:GumC family protein [Altericroceibacterium xinjiangense]|uniref:GumC family protein n=1 Tax=Altericroceibacterium xinjiangense TaxID=762261 RepID=UPI0013E07643|nr:polysaccharide biosynthesis tyrosine autokinase [Altericroceibacterium xinjiangense]
MIAIIGGCLLAGVTITLLMPKRYTAQSQVEISRDQKQITNVQGLESQEAGRDIEFYATQYALLQTRPLAERVVADLNLLANPAFFVSQGEGDRYEELVENRDLATLKREAVDLLLLNVTIDPVRTSRLVNVRFTSQSPELSAAIANDWIKAFMASNIARQFASTADAREILEQRLAVLRDRLEQSERRVVNYATNQGIVTLDQARDETGRSMIGRTLVATDLEALNEALNGATAARIAAQARTNSNPGVSSEVINSQAIALLRQQRAEAAGNYAQLLENFEPDFPQAREAKRRLDTLDTMLEREVSRISGNRDEEYQEALRREQELRERVTDLKQRLDSQQRASIQYAIFQREADTNRQLYDALLQRYKEIGVAGTVAASNVAITEPAEVPRQPSSPSLLINLTIALLAGVSLAALTVFVLDQIDEGVHDPTELKAELGVPLLGYTPAIEGVVQDELADPKSAFYEAYFSVRSNLSFATTKGFPKSLMVTSTRAAEGKSSSSLALSAVLGRTGRRVLLIDADLRSPSVHGLLDLTNLEGLSTVLSGQEDWRSVVQPTSLKNVSVIATGPMPPNAAELLSGDSLDRMLGECAAEYDHVIIDAPPVLGLADAPIISRTVEGVVLIVEYRGPAIRTIKSSIERLRQAHGHIFGAVLTKMRTRDSGYGYGRGFGDGYSYGDDEDARTTVA